MIHQNSAVVKGTCLYSSDLIWLIILIIIWIYTRSFFHVAKALLVQSRITVNELVGQCKVHFLGYRPTGWICLEEELIPWREALVIYNRRLCYISERRSGCWGYSQCLAHNLGHQRFKADAFFYRTMCKSTRNQSYTLKSHSLSGIHFKGMLNPFSSTASLH